MNNTNSTNKLKEVVRLKQALKENPRNVDALLALAVLLGTLKTPDLDTKRQMLKIVLTLEPANPKARQMLFEMDRAAIGGDTSRLSAAAILTPQPSYSLLEKPLKVRYSILHQSLVYPVLAFSLWLMFRSFGQWDVFPVFASFFLLVLIPVWSVSAVLKINNSGIRLSRMFGVYRREMEWIEIESIQPAILGVGIKLTTGDGRSVTISSQMNGYSSIVEILHQMRPDLFDLDGVKIFRKGFLSKYGLLLFAVLMTPLALGAVLVPPFLPGILLVVLAFYFLRSALQTVHFVKVEENRLSTKSLRKSQELNVQQISNIKMVTAYNRRGVRKSLVQIELNEAGKFTLSGFPEGNEIMYGFLRNWWNGYQTS